MENIKIKRYLDANIQMQDKNSNEFFTQMRIS